MQKSKLKQIIREVISEDIFLQNRKSPEEKAKMRELEIEVEYKSRFGVEVYEGNLILTEELLPYFKKYSKIKIMNENFDCGELNLISLTELPIPEYVNGNFYCYGNKLTSLQGAPKYVGGNFWCDYNDLTSLKGAPKEVSGDFYCENNSTKFTKEDVRKVCDVRDRIIC